MHKKRQKCRFHMIYVLNSNRLHKLLMEDQGCIKAHISDVLAMAHQGGSTTIVDHLIR